MKKNIAIVSLCYVMWGFLAIFWKLLQEVSPFYILGSRIVWSLLLCFIMIYAARKKEELKAALKVKKTLMLTVLAGVTICINWGTYIWGVNNGYILECSLGYYINPLMMILFGMLFFQEKMSGQEILSVALATAGVIIMTASLGKIPYISIILSISFAIYGALKKMTGLDSDVSLTIETATSFPFALLFMLFSEIHHTGALGILHGAEYLLLPLTGVVTTVPLLLFGYGVKHLPYSIVGIVQYISPTIQLLLGVFLYKEEFTYTHLVTFILIWTALILFIGSKMKKKKEQTAIGEMEQAV